MIQVNVKAQYHYNNLVWQDEFNCEGSMPDTTKWSYDNGNGCPNLCGWGNNELQYYTTARQENAHIKCCRLVIEARKESFDNYNYTSARMVTKNKGDWTDIDTIKKDELNYSNFVRQINRLTENTTNNSSF